MVISVNILCGMFFIVDNYIDGVCLYLGNCVSCYSFIGEGVKDGYYLLLMKNLVVGVFM